MSKLLVTCTAICLFGLSCYGITKLEQRFEERWLIPDDSYLAKWFDDQREFFKQGGERGTIYFADFNLTNNQLERITQLVKNLKNETEIWKEGNLVMEFYQGAAQGAGFIEAIGGDSSDPDSLAHSMVKDWHAEYKWTVSAGTTH